MNQERFERAITILTLIDEQDIMFDMDYWGHITECGTTRCAIGWLTSDPSIQADGFVLYKSSEYSFGVAYGDSRGFQAVADYFDIDYDLVIDLFDSLSYDFNPRLSDVIQRMKEYFSEDYYG